MPENDNFNAPFKYTIPVLRASEGEDGLYLEGEASGPEMDTWGTRVDPRVIVDFAEQIRSRAEGGNPIPYRDTHGQGVTGDQPVMADMGELVAATVTDDSHLRVRVKLDADNPAARYLHKQIQRGKRYGMSIGGSVLSYEDTFDKESGKIVRTFQKIMLDHIANTSQPAWTPSLGTVLMRAVERALEGENMESELPAPESPAVEGAEETPEVEATTEAAAEESTEETAETAEEETEETVEEATATDESEVRMIEVTELAPVAEAVSALAAAVAALTAPKAQPVPVALSAAPTSDAARSVESESPVAENDDVKLLRAAIESLTAELATANGRIAQLEQEPAGNQPGVIQRSETNPMEELAKLPAHDRLLLGLQAARAAANSK